MDCDVWIVVCVRRVGPYSPDNVHGEDELIHLDQRRRKWEVEDDTRSRNTPHAADMVGF